MKQVIVVTHAQAQHHLDGVVGGWHDSSLSELGKIQTQSIAQRLADDASVVEPMIFSSDLKRAKQTALPISKLYNTPVLELDGLREISYGDAEGKEQGYLDKRFVPPPAKGDRMNHLVCEGAESRQDLAERIYNTMDGIYAGMKECSIVVTHGFAHTFVVSWWVGLPIDNAGHVHFATSAGAITYLVEDDMFHNRSVEILNDTTHLK